MTDLNTLKSCELHVHLGGCLYAEDLLELGRDIYQQVDWHLYIKSFEQAYGITPDPVSLFSNALKGGEQELEHFRHHFVFSQSDGTDFACFQAKFNLIISLYRHLRHLPQRQQEIVPRILARHRAEGLDYVEYRAMPTYAANDDPEGFINFHRLNATTMQTHSRDDFTARYIVSLPRWAPLEGYILVQRLLDENPELISTIVGLDFCFFEEGYPPASLQAFFERLQRDNEARPERALDVVYHVGEVYFDKSLESAVRWCHQAAELGSRRLGHAIALGLDPAIAVARQANAHQSEPVGERLAQIDYDLQYAEQLTTYDIDIDVDALQQERIPLATAHADAKVDRPYTPQRLQEIRQRQTFVLDRLVELGAMIESCPTSNLRLGGVPNPASHPIHRFLDSSVDLAICADDPGIFNAPLATEVDWVDQHTNIKTQALVQRLGDPRRFRLQRDG